MLARSEWIPPEPSKFEKIDYTVLNRILCRLTLGSGALMVLIATASALIV